MTQAAHSEVSSEQQGMLLSGTPVPFEQTHIEKHSGARYYAVLSDVHKHLRPRSYLEVGIRSGHSLALAHCPTIGIDPRFSLDPKFGLDAPDRQPPVFLYKMTSDDFFDEHDPLGILGVASIDFMFLDGMHQSDFLLRDIINSERYAGRDSIIALHDCMPIDIAMTLSKTERAATPFPVVYPNFWAGDVWRVVPILMKYRPELSIHCMNAHPTGLVLITNLDSTSTVLSDNYDAIVEEMRQMELASIGLRSFSKSIGMTSTDKFLGEDNLLRRFRRFAPD